MAADAPIMLRIAYNAQRTIRAVDGGGSTRALRPVNVLNSSG